MEKDNGGDGPMHWAAKRGFMEVMCAMKSAGADPKMPGELIVKKLGFEYIIYPRYNSLCILIFNFYYKGRRGNNMLHCAASKGCLELVDFLLDNQFQDNPDVRNDLGETPLHLAAAHFTKGKI